MDANCAHCHRPGVGRATIDFRLVRMLPFQGIVVGPVADPLGITDPLVVAPGDLDRSVLWQRVRSTTGCCSMPPLGRAVLDRTFVAMVLRWIATMNARARPGVVAQSSTDAGAGAERAVDGDIRGDFALNTVSRTLSTLAPLWDLDLGSSHHVERVRLWNRTDCCGSLLSDFYVFLSPVPFAGTTVAAALQQPGVIARHFSATVAVTAALAFAADGRYLRIQLAGSSPLSLAEVRVEGYALPAGPLPPQYPKPPAPKTRR